MPNEPPPPPHASNTDLQLIADPPPPRVPQNEEIAAAANKREREQLELDQLRGVVQQLLQDIKQRKRYAKRLYRVMVGWLAVVAYVVLAQGFATKTPFIGAPFHLADIVQIVLITTTTATVLGGSWRSPIICSPSATSLRSKAEPHALRQARHRPGGGYCRT